MYRYIYLPVGDLCVSSTLAGSRLQEACGRIAAQPQCAAIFYTFKLCLSRPWQRYTILSCWTHENDMWLSLKPMCSALESAGRTLHPRVLTVSENR